MIRASISPPRNAIIVFLVTFGDVGAFGVSASSTILSFALSFTFAIILGAILAMESHISFDS